jgi:hypothetical protein
MIAAALVVCAVVLALALKDRFQGDVQSSDDVSADTRSEVSATAVSEAVSLAVHPAQAGVLEPPGVAKPLKLFAVYPGRTETRGRAVLGPAEASSRTYVVGALLENGARLTRIFADRAQLLKDRRTYTLYLPGRQRSDELSADERDLSVGAFAEPHPPLEPAPVRATDFIRAVPAYNGELIAGFTVYPGGRSAEFAKWGLEPGDVLASVDGQLLSDPAQMESILDQLAGGAVLSADVRRGDGERQRVTLDGGALLAATTTLPPFAIP